LRYPFSLLRAPFGKHRFRGALFSDFCNRVESSVVDSYKHFGGTYVGMYQPDNIIICVTVGCIIVAISRVLGCLFISVMDRTTWM